MSNQAAENPYANKAGTAKRGKEFEWLEWEQQTYLTSIWQLPMEERRARAISSHKFQLRCDSEGGYEYSHEENERRLQELLALYKAI